MSVPYPVYEEVEEKGIMDNLLKGVKGLFKGGSSKGESGGTYIEPQVIEVKIPKCNAITKTVSTLLTQDVPVSNKLFFSRYKVFKLFQFN